MLGVTEDTYFEMCEAMGTEPVESEIPVTLNSMPEDIQLAFSLYYKLPDRWDGMSGTYLGKDLSCFTSIASILEIEDMKTHLNLILLIDGVRVEILAERQKQKNSKSKGT